jgi:hypothetical protein
MSWFTFTFTWYYLNILSSWICSTISTTNTYVRWKCQCFISSVFCDIFVSYVTIIGTRVSSTLSIGGVSNWFISGTFYFTCSSVTNNNWFLTFRTPTSSFSLSKYTSFIPKGLVSIFIITPNPIIVITNFKICHKH